MTKTVEYILEYYENAEKKTAILNINFVPNKIHTKYRDLLKGADRVQELANENQSLLVEKIDCKDRDRKKEINERIKDIDLEIRANEKLINSRFELIAEILEINGIKEFSTFEFWDECVDVNTANEFLNAVILKDFPDKKKVTI